jgi:glycosyltransferase involved in cell wall biosynthesis
MRLLFVYWAFEDQGSGLVIQGYTEAARALGHEVAVYGCWRLGRDNPRIPLNYSLDVASADAAVFIFEWTTALKPGDRLDLLRLVAGVPRTRRVILDGDGNYNDMIRVAGGDFNHADEAASRRWVEVCDSLSDKVCQPTLHPRRPNVRPFLFYAYNPAWERPPDGRDKNFALAYVGHSKFRWRALGRVLRAVEPVRDRVGRIALVGHGWDQPPWWAGQLHLEQAYFSDPDRLRRLGVETLPAVRFEEVIDSMSRATVNPVLARPLFEELRFVTPRMFETVAAGTVPLFVLDPAHVREIYGDAALDLVLPEDGAAEKVLDMASRPGRYAEAVRAVRRHLAEKHSHAARLRQLIEIIES